MQYRLQLHALQELLFILDNCCLVLDISFNAKKTVCMNLCPRDKSKCISGAFPLLTLFGQTLEFVSEFRHLGHIINNLLSDAYIPRFGRCSRAVKIRLFRTFCACLYGSALWTIYSKTSLRRFRSCFHKCLKMFFRYEMMHSVTSLVLELSLPSFDSLLLNFRFSFNVQWKSCSNSIITHLKCLNVSGLIL